MEDIRKKKITETYTTEANLVLCWALYTFLGRIRQQICRIQQPDVIQMGFNKIIISYLLFASNHLAAITTTADDTLDQFY